MGNVLDLVGVLVVISGLIVGVVAVTGVSPGVTNPLNPVSLYTVSPNACLEQTPLRFGFTQATVDFEEQENVAFAAIAPTDPFALGAQNAELSISLEGETVNGDTYSASPITTRFDVSDIEFIIGTDKCTEAVGTTQITGVDSWNNIPAGTYTVTFTITDNGETVDTVTRTVDMPNTKGDG